MIGYISCADLLAANALPNDMYVFSVKHSKTLSTTGCPKVALSGFLYKALSTYATLIRPTVMRGHAEHDWLFVNIKGEPMDSRTINTFLRLAWAAHCNNIELTPVPYLTTRILRKSVTTHSRNADWISADEQKLLDKHKDHTTATADRYYNLSGSTKMSVVAAEMITSLWQEEPTTESEEELVSFHISFLPCTMIQITYLAQ